MKQTPREDMFWKTLMNITSDLKVHYHNSSLRTTPPLATAFTLNLNILFVFKSEVPTGILKRYLASFNFRSYQKLATLSVINL